MTLCKSGRAKGRPLSSKFGWSTVTTPERRRGTQQSLEHRDTDKCCKVDVDKNMNTGKKPTEVQNHERYGRKLRRAAEEGRAHDVEALLQRGADVNYVRPSIPGYVILAPNDTPLHAAAEKGQKAVVDILIAAGADLNQRTVLEHSGRSTEDSAPIHVASKNGHENIMKALLLAGADVDLGDTTGDTALHMAASKGHKSALDILLQAGAQVNLQSCSGQTPLHEAVANGHEDIVKTLLVAGGDPGIRNKRRETPLEAAKDFLESRGKSLTQSMTGLLEKHDASSDHQGRLHHIPRVPDLRN